MVEIASTSASSCAGNAALNGVRTVHNIYMLTNPKSGDGFANQFISGYPRANHCTIEAVVTRKKGSVQFLLPENLREVEKA